MNPSNRRVRPQKLPYDAKESGGASDPGTLVDPPAPAGQAAPKRARSRTGTIVRAALGVLLVVGVSSTVAWGAKKHIMSSARFSVKEIEVNGAKHRTSEEVIQRAGLAVGANVFMLDLDASKAKLLADPWISEATLARRLPGTLLVQVTEREAAAIVSLGDSWLATREGDLFKRLEAGDPAELPIVTGLTQEALAEDRDGVKRQVRRAVDLSADYEHTPLSARAPLQEIHYEPGGGVTLTVGREGLKLVVGDPPFRKKLDQAARVLTELEKRKAKAEAIMLDNEARPERVVVRMK